MTGSQVVYEGDAALVQRLAAAGAESNMAKVRAFVAGVVGAPQRDERWIELIAPAADGLLRTQLRALRDAVAEAHDAGLQVRPGGDRLVRLRQRLAADGLDGFMVPRTDEHQGEFVAPRAERLRWLTGFAGSAGLAIVLAERAAIFVDGRYTLQVRQQTDCTAFDPQHLIDAPPDNWIAENLPKGAKLGYDPRLHAQASIERYGRAAAKAGGELVAVDENPIDAIWEHQPAAPISPIVPHDIAYAGKSSAEKRAELGAELKKDGTDAAVLTQPDSIAWLLNLRGGDVQHTPLPLSYAILHRSGAVDWFVDRRKLLPEVTEQLGNEVTAQPVAAFGGALEDLARDEARVRVDPATAAAFVFDRLKGAEIVRQEDPCVLPKAIKNAVEIAGTRSAHERDGAALTRFLAWFAGEAPKGTLTEIAASDRLQAFRQAHGAFRDLSFPTISSTGPNGAVVHYHASPETNRTIGAGELYLVDSGAQYQDGTTDVTRTIAVGRPTDEMRDRFTRVLKGHIALAMARFPEGTTGAQLDTLARAPLWQVGLDFDHGTGHGVGSYLGVHEGPQRISKAGSVPLKPGMIVSNEPGYYKAEAFGIRIENLVVVRRCDDLDGAERPTMEFETLTLAPIDLALVDRPLLSDPEAAWLNAYHARVRETHAPHLDDRERAWLEQATRPI